MIPWFGWSPATMHFCEALTAGPLAQPANAVSSLAFCAVGVSLYRTMQEKNALLLFPISAFLVGITSFLYHASWTFFFQVFDVSSMLMLSCLLMSFNAARLSLVDKRRLPVVYVALLVLSIAALVTLRGKSGEYIFGVEIALVAAMEAVLARRRLGTDYAPFLKALAVFLAAYAIWLTDVHELVCAPDNHYLQGHAVWHVLNAFCFYFLYRFYRQFDLVQSSHAIPVGETDAHRA
ncbi:MAG TPA: ceramidase domain-containing protein [Elusimicrobiota bacterium]|nr:ceramidase domain-containing protein [Elusimicrobiota bacterium]